MMRGLVVCSGLCCFVNTFVQVPALFFKLTPLLAVSVYAVSSVLSHNIVHVDDIS